MRVLICGGRHYDDAAAIRRELDRLHGGQPIGVLIHGGLAAIGNAAEAWAREHNVHVVRYPPNWTLLGNRAEARRNAFMLEDSRPDVLLAFPGGRDTADLVRLARVAATPVRLAPAGRPGCGAEAKSSDSPEGRSRGFSRHGLTAVGCSLWAA
ncbi:DUF2493 domain-containing protein [Phreatobacter stygius]|uniref:DUF2493 domain-containing protein n=1 Tax=Phreatobacter stygius TaxID=1940610 RepID=A0A4D7BC71_9HYPH|nr:DUF2493 domain-containing protein [Phreatobacter stygius]QCI66986.1 DUF2493 domain-containing protein [Phreatobacter stygius]